MIKYGRPLPGNTIKLNDETIDLIQDSDINTTDIWLKESTWSGWVDLDSTGKEVIQIPFNGLHTRIQNNSADNPKILLCHLTRTAGSHQVGIGASSGNFSNVKISLLGSGHVTRTLVDESGDNTKYTSRNFEFEPQLYNAIKIEFYTADTVTISNITVQKSKSVTSQIKGIKSDGTLVAVGASDAGNLKVTNAEDGLAIASGEVPGKTFIHKFGAAPDFDESDGYVSIWDGADDGNIAQMNYVYSTAADIDSVSSENAGDTQVVQLQGLDGAYTLTTQTVTLNGQNRVALSTPLIRIFRMKNTGSTDNVGHVYCYVNTAISGGVPIDTTKVRAVIQPGNNQTLMALYTIPLGYVGYMRDWYASTAGASRNSSYVIELRARPLGGVFQLKHVAALSDDGTSYIQHTYVEPEVFGGMVDLEMRAYMTLSSASSAAVSAGFDIVLVEN